MSIPFVTQYVSPTNNIFVCSQPTHHIQISQAKPYYIDQIQLTNIKSKCDFLKYVCIVLLMDEKNSIVPKQNKTKQNKKNSQFKNMSCQ